MSPIGTALCKPFHGIAAVYPKFKRLGWTVAIPANLSDEVKRILNADVDVAKHHELHTFAVIPKRWVVERSFAWLEKCRRLWKNCEGLINTRLQMVVLAFLALRLKRI
jgi:transposase